MIKARTLGALAVAGLGFVATGCTSDTPSPSETRAKARVVTIDGVPFLAGATHGTGAPLRDGLEVVDGSRLLADVFPSPNGWFATIVVTGDPREVLPAYAQQAERLDMPVPEVRCGTSTIGEGSQTITSCRAWSVDAKGSRTFELDYERRGRCCGTQPRSHLLLRYSTAVDPALLQFMPAPLPDPLDAVAVQPLPWGLLPVLGQSFEPGSDSHPAMAVMEGVHLVGPAGPADAASGPGGAIFRVDGDVDEVVRGYLRAGDSTNVTTSRSTRDGVRIAEHHWTNGDTYTLTTYQRAGRPTWLVVQHALGD